MNAQTRPVLISTAMQAPAGVPDVRPYAWPVRLAVWVGVAVLPWTILGAAAWLLVH